MKSLRVGDLVVGKDPPPGMRALCGILLERSSSNDRRWVVLCEDGLAVEELEQRMALVVEMPAPKY